MFETVVPETVAPRSRRLFYETLPLSVGLHALAAGAILVGTVWNVVFPEHSPRMYAAYQLAAAPPPPPPPPPPPLVKSQVVSQTRAVPVKMPFVAPTIIPDEIPIVEAEPVPLTNLPVVPVADTAGEGGGIEGGVEGGEVGGEIGGVIGGIVLPPPPENANQVEIKRDEPLPMGAISQEYPIYPEFAQRRNLEDWLVVRYIIGKNGRVKDVIVLTPPAHEAFTRATVSKIRQWRFLPFRDAQGQPKEVAHELTVAFRLVRKAGK